MPPDNFSKEAKKHVAEAWRNYCLYERWLDSEPNWALVLMFYSSLHLVQAHAEDLCSKRQHLHLPQNHSERASYISSNLPKIVVDYRELQTASEDVRYQLVRYSRDDVLDFYSGQFSRILEILYIKRVSWDIRLTEDERNTILNAILNEGKQSI